jgi:hypothetical protein
MLSLLADVSGQFCGMYPSLLERDRMQFLHCSAVVPEVIDGCSDGREGKVFEWRGNHGV